MNKREEKIHMQVCDWLRAQHLEVEFRTDGGGLRLPIGLAAKFKRMQKGKSWPDLFIAEPVNGLHGLFIEIKAEPSDLFLKDGKTLRSTQHIREQKKQLEKLRRRGYAAFFTVGFDGTIYTIGEYLNGRVENEE